MKGQSFLTFIIFSQKHTCLWNLCIQENRLFLDSFLATPPVYTKFTQITWCFQELY